MKRQRVRETESQRDREMTKWGDWLSALKATCWAFFLFPLQPSKIAHSPGADAMGLCVHTLAVGCSARFWTSGRRKKRG